MHSGGGGGGRAPSHGNAHRRMVRGRTGPTDRQLPKYNASAHRRRPPQEEEERNAIVEDENSDSEEDLEMEGVSELEIVEPYVSDAAAVPMTEMMELSEVEATPNLPEEEPEKEYHKEIQHLLRRIQNNRRSWSTSTATGLVRLERYQTNVLAAALNTLREWRSLRRRHYGSIDAATLREVGHALFGLLQQSLQCGPLAGAQPGYLKRGGGAVAAAVCVYLRTALRDREDAVHVLGLSPAQADRIAQWQGRAQKAAADADAAPSQSIQKQCARAQRVQSAKKKKKKKTKSTACRTNKNSNIDSDSSSDN